MFFPSTKNFFAFGKNTKILLHWAKNRLIFMQKKPERFHFAVRGAKSDRLLLLKDQWLKSDRLLLLKRPLVKSDRLLLLQRPWC